MTWYIASANLVGYSLSSFHFSFLTSTPQTTLFLSLSFLLHMLPLPIPKFLCTPPTLLFLSLNLSLTSSLPDLLSLALHPQPSKPLLFLPKCNFHSFAFSHFCQFLCPTAPSLSLVPNSYQRFCKPVPFLAMNPSRSLAC
jgi:hypothetical protein